MAWHGMAWHKLNGHPWHMTAHNRGWLSELPDHLRPLATTLSPDREALELAGVQPERVQTQLAAKERAKQARLYSGHAACVSHSSSSCASGMAATAVLREPAAGPAASLGPAAAAWAAAATPGPEAGADPATPTAVAAASLGPAAEPERGSAEWLAAQEAYEDAHLGQFERVMPPPDPQLVGAERWGLGGCTCPCQAADAAWQDVCVQRRLSCPCVFSVPCRPNLH